MLFAVSGAPQGAKRAQSARAVLCPALRRAVLFRMAVKPLSVKNLRSSLLVYRPASAESQPPLRWHEDTARLQQNPWLEAMEISMSFSGRKTCERHLPARRLFGTGADASARAVSLVHRRKRAGGRTAASTATCRPVSPLTPRPPRPCLPWRPPRSLHPPRPPRPGGVWPGRRRRPPCCRRYDDLDLMR